MKTTSYAGVILATTTLLSLTALPATAAPSYTDGDRQPHSNQHHTSPGWAGYWKLGDYDEYDSVTASWTVPTLNCTKTRENSHNSIWVGIGGTKSDAQGNSADTLPQTGIQLSCLHGVASYRAFWEQPAPNNTWNDPDEHGIHPDTVTAGDAITSSVKRNAATGKWDMTVTNHTRGWTATASKPTVPGNRTGTSAEVINEIDPINTIPYQVKFTDVSLTRRGEQTDFISHTDAVDTDFHGVTKASVGSYRNHAFHSTVK
ncbi:hypothetical protein SSP35_02_02620 [Streptomyces sp. NBRC 110611]|uniref:G1 family glutamic endopeptidase n=1 Tax=Streptomyces sp. NBRC 110611 TaxID=1621259 RepID=UPI00082FC95F|nr:G1 family glutamic endopeptidase [Streptomyces sp. NBRC 110611]GAU65893.1 hypothetical protein SSP35_02_02620 [Streptomyces sp. NBRC 110611]